MEVSWASESDSTATEVQSEIPEIEEESAMGEQGTSEAKQGLCLRLQVRDSALPHRSATRRAQSERSSMRAISSHATCPVSYTHLTLPTKRIV